MARSVPSPSTPSGFFSPQVTANQRFYLDLGRRRTTPLSVVAGGFESCAPDYVVERKSFPFFALEFVSAGEGEVQLGEITFPLSKGSVFAYSAAIPHRITSSVPPLEKYFLTFHGRAARHLLQEAALAPGTCRQIERPAELRVVWEEVLRLGLDSTTAGAGPMALGLRFLLTLIAERGEPDPVPSRARLTLQRCEIFLQQHFLTVHRLSEVAEACHVDLPYLCRLSQRFLGHTLYQHLQRLKMNWAAERLQSGCLVREAADGLSLDPFQFSRTFKRVHGVSPSEFQKLYGGHPGDR